MVLVLEPVVIMRGHVDFAAYYRLYARMLLGKFEEFFHPVHVSMVGNGDSRHAELFCPVEQVFYR